MSANVPANTIDDATKAFQASIQTLADALERRVDYPENMAEMVLAVADEYGAEHAIERLFEGSVARPDAETLANLTARVERMLEARDWLDLITAKARDAAGRQIIDIHGARYVVDADAKVLRGADGTTISLDVPHAPQPEPTLSQQMRAVAGLDPVEPRTPEPRTRQR